jgi:hypothetical protein
MTSWDDSCFYIEVWLESQIARTGDYEDHERFENSPWYEILQRVLRLRQPRLTTTPNEPGTAAGFTADSLTTDTARLEQALADVTLALATHTACCDSSGYLRVSARNLQALMNAAALWEKHRVKDRRASLSDEAPAPRAAMPKTPKINLIIKR